MRRPLFRLELEVEGHCRPTATSSLSDKPHPGNTARFPLYIYIGNPRTHRCAPALGGALSNQRQLTAGLRGQKAQAPERMSRPPAGRGTRGEYTHVEPFSQARIIPDGQTGNDGCGVLSRPLPAMPSSVNG